MTDRGTSSETNSCPSGSSSFIFFVMLGLVWGFFCQARKHGPDIHRFGFAFSSFRLLSCESGIGLQGASWSDCCFHHPGRLPLAQARGPANSYPVEPVAPDHGAPFAGSLGSLGGRDQSCWRPVAAIVRNGLPPTQVGSRPRRRSPLACRLRSVRCYGLWQTSSQAALRRTPCGSSPVSR